MTTSYLDAYLDSRLGSTETSWPDRVASTPPYVHWYTIRSNFLERVKQEIGCFYLAAKCTQNCRSKSDLRITEASEDYAEMNVLACLHGAAGGRAGK